MFISQKIHSSFGPFSFYKKVLAIALPVMAQMLIQNLVSLIDNFMVAGLGDVKMSGVNICGQINFIFISIINAICYSGGIYISQFNGAKNPEGMQQAFKFKLIVCLAIGIVFSIVSFRIPEKILPLMVHGNLDSESIIAQGAQYMRVLAFSWIPMVFATIFGSSLREIGSVKAPLVISILATVINSVFNYMLIYGNCNFPRLEVTGAALATIIARTCEMIIFVIFILKKQPDFLPKLKKIFTINFSLFFSILKKTGFILISEISWVASETVTTALYNSRGGSDIVSGMAGGFAIANLFYICFNGIFVSTGVVLGGTLGANRLEEARIQKKWLLSGSALFGSFVALVGSLTLLLIPLIYGNLTLSAQAVAKGLVLVNIFYMPSWAYLNAQFAVSRTGGDTTMGLLVDLIANVGMVIPGMFILTYFTTCGPVAMYGIIKLTDFIKITIAHLWLKKERWLKNLTLC